LSQIRKFAFDREFSSQGAVLRESAVLPKKLAPEEVEALCAQAYERGKQDAVAAAERETAAALKEIAAQSQAALSRLDHEARDMRAEAARIAISAARKIADTALDGFGADRALGAIEATMDALRHQPRLMVKVSESNLENLSARIESACASHAYGGAVIVRADPNLKTGAVSIDWGAGVIVSDPENVLEKVQHMVEAALASDAAE
jgi:flagellar assembly protein FliH